MDAKSILAILTLAAAQGTQLTIKATGEDAGEALDALSGCLPQASARTGNSRSERINRQRAAAMLDG